MKRKTRDNNKNVMQGRKLQHEEISRNRLADDCDEPPVFSYLHEYRSKRAVPAQSKPQELRRQ
jgi:hypothetical protein